MDLSTVRADPGPSQHRDIRLSHAIAAAATHAQIALTTAIRRVAGFHAGASRVALHATARVGAKLNGVVARLARFDAVLAPGRMSRNPKAASNAR